MATRHAEEMNVDVLAELHALIARCEGGDCADVWDLDAPAIGQSQASRLIRRRLIPVLRKQRALTELAHVLRLYLAVVSGTAADRLMLASVLGQLGKTDEARSILDELGLEAPADAAVATARIQRALQDGHGDAAQAIAMQFRQWEHVPVRAAHLGMLALVRGGHPQAALDLFAACPDDPDGVLTSVAINAHRDLRQMDEADRLARRAIKQGRGTAALHYQLGISAHEAGNHDRAVVHFTQGLECAPDDLRILAAIGEVLLVLGRPAAALIHLTRALKLAPDLVHMRVLQARGFKAIRDYDGAAREWRDIVARQPEVPQWRREAASVLNLAGRHGEARALFGDLLRTRTAALPPSFEDGLEDLWGRADQVELPSARLEWAWRLRDPAIAMPREEWTRRAQWGYLADRLIYDWLECSPERAEQAMHRLADLDTSADLLTSDASQSGGLIIVTAHIGPMFAGPLALQLLDFESVWLASSPSMPGMSYTDSLISTSDQTDAQVVRRAIHALEAGKAVGLAVDGAMSLAAPRITFEGQEITYSSFAARLGHRRRARSFFTAPLWQDGRLTFHLAPLPFPDGDEDIDTYADRWRDAYLGQLRQMLAGEPENLRLSGGIWRHVRMPS